MLLRDAHKVRAVVGVLTEHHGLYGRMNGIEYLNFFGKLYGLTNAACQQRSMALLEQFGLQDAVKKRLGTVFERHAPEIIAGTRVAARTACAASG